MTTIRQEDFIQSVADAFQFISFYHPADYIRDLWAAYQREESPAAKDAMKAFNKKNNINSCNKCHTKLAPSYELKADGLEQYKKLGGK